MFDELLNTGLEGMSDVLAGLPLRWVAEFIERTDGLQKRIGSRLADTVIVVGELADKLNRALLDVRQEVLTSGVEDAADGVGSNLLLNADGAVDIEHLVNVNVDVLAVTIVDHRDGSGGGGARGEADNGFGVRAIDATVLAMLKLLQAGDESGNHLGQVGREVLPEDASHDAEEQEAALAKSRAAEIDAGKGLLHHLGEVWQEDLLPDGLSERANGVHGNTTEFLLLTLTDEGQEVLEVVHCGLEVSQELVLGGMSCATNGTDDD